MKAQFLVQGGEPSTHDVPQTLVVTITLRVYTTNVQESRIESDLIQLNCLIQVSCPGAVNLPTRRHNWRAMKWIVTLRLCCGCCQVITSSTLQSNGLTPVHPTSN